MTRKISTYQKGFTLVEIILVLTIISIFSTIVISAINTYNKYATIKSYADTIVSDLTRAKTLALTQSKPSGCSGNTLTGYQFVISGSTYSIQAVCSSSVTVSTVSIPSSQLQFDANVGKTITGPIFFPVLTNQVDLTTTGSNGQITLCDTSNTISEVIQVDAVGNISQLDNQAGCP